MTARADPPTRAVLTKVPEITAIFWVLKLLTTGMGESMSDFLGSRSVPIAGGVALIVFLALVAYVTVTKVDVQGAPHPERSHLYLEPQPELAPELD
jgi:uncharacterized membrane-anchored protein